MLQGEDLLQKVCHHSLPTYSPVPHDNISVFDGPIKLYDLVTIMVILVCVKYTLWGSHNDEIT
jgi:hypothetical protein